MDYKLFQIADLICTIELPAEKAETNSLTNSELDFFDNIRDKKKLPKAFETKISMKPWLFG